MGCKRLLNIEQLTPGLILESDVYDLKTGIMLYKKGTVLTKDKIHKLNRFTNLSVLVDMDFNNQNLKIEENIIIKEIEIGFDELYKYANYIVLSVLNNVSLKRILNKIDNEVYNHSYHVAIISTMIAINLSGFDESCLKDLAVSAILHDIGKAMIDYAILNKPGALTDDEYRIIQLHPQYGYNILKETALFSENICDAVLSHHENADGSGYPNNKTNIEISLYGKIIHLADVYSALVNKRSYKDEWTSSAALKQIEYEKRKFDPILLDVLRNSLPIYAKNDIVYLSTNELAKVIDCSKENISLKILGEKRMININDKDKIYIKKKIMVGG